MRRAGRAGWCLCFVLAACFCLPVLADEGARAGDGPTAGAESIPSMGPWGGGGTARSFGLGGSSVFGSGGVTGERPQAAPPQRFSLWPDPVATDIPDRPGLWWEPPTPAFQPAPAPGEPLRGVRNASSPFATKFWRGTFVITGAEIACGVVLALLPKSNTNWEDGTLNHGFSNVGRAFTTLPVWDSDGAFHDWIGHPYAGAFYYNMIRSQGGTVGQSFAFSVFESLMWEYVLESFAEQPSLQDLVSTSLIGSVLGELFHRWSTAIIRKGNLNFGQKALVFFLNPSYVINNGYRSPE